MKKRQNNRPIKYQFCDSYNYFLYIKNLNNKHIFASTYQQVFTPTTNYCPNDVELKFCLTLVHSITKSQKQSGK